MHQSFAEAAQGAERRACPRHYLTRPLRAELIYGRARFGLDSGSVGNVSRTGLGLRADLRVGAHPGTLATVALAKEGSEIMTLSGEVASVRNGFDIGIKLVDSDLQRLRDWLGEGLDSTAISSPKNGLAHVSGKLSVSSLHPVRWATTAGARRLNLEAVTAIDSAGIALLMLFGEKEGVRVEDCPEQVCRLLRLAARSGLCAASCARANWRP